MPPAERPEQDLAALLRAAVVAGAGDGGQLAALSMRCWPGGADRSVSPALEWLRRWGPRRMVAAAPACGCKQGRCRVCN